MQNNVSDQPLKLQHLKPFNLYKPTRNFKETQPLNSHKDPKAIITAIISKAIDQKAGFVERDYEMIETGRHCPKMSAQYIVIARQNPQ